MKRLKIIGIAILCIQIFLSSCKTGNSIIVDDGTNRKEIKYSGDITFNDDETDIESISSDGYLEFRSNGRKLIVENNYHGGLKYEMYEGGRRLAEDEQEGKRFLGEVIEQMISMGFNLQKRMENLHSKGGNPALLRASVNVDGSFAKQQYLDYILLHGSPGNDDLVDVANITAFKIENAFEKAQVLKKFPGNGFNNAEVTDAWFGAVRTVDSDFEKSNILKEILPENIVISSFSEKWLNAVQSINSDFEKSNTLKTILQQPLSEEQYRHSITVANTLNGDFERSNFLKDIIDKGIPENEENFSVLMSAIHKVESDFERSNILKKLIETGLHNEAQWESLLKESATLNGDFEKADVFLSAAGKMPKTAALKSVYLREAKVISAEHEQERVVKGLE